MTEDLTAWSDIDYHQRQQQKKGNAQLFFFSKAFNRTHLVLSFVKIYTHFLSSFFFFKKEHFNPIFPMSTTFCCPDQKTSFWPIYLIQYNNILTIKYKVLSYILGCYGHCNGTAPTLVTSCNSVHGLL